MTWIAVAVAGAGLVGGMMSANAQTDAANTAAGAQTAATQAGIAEQQRQFDRVQGLLNPFVQAATGVPAQGGGGGQYTARSTAPAGAAGAGSIESADQIRSRLLPQYTTAGGRQIMENTGEWGGSSFVDVPSSVNEQALNAAVQAELARQQSFAAPAAGAPAGGSPGGYMAPGGGGSLAAQQDVIGLNGPEAQAAAIANLQKMPAFTSALQLGENRILQNASATGGLRGGNTQGALAYFAPSLLAQQINDYYGRLAGITSLGENAAALTGNAGMTTGQGVSGLLQQAGSAQAGAAVAGGVAQTKLYDSLNGALGQYKGMGGNFSGFGGGITPDAIQGYFAQSGAGGSGFGTGMAYGNQDYGLFI